MAGDEVYDIEVGLDAEQTVIWVRGEIDLHARATFVRAVEEAARRSRRLVFNMSGTTFIDGCGLGVLLDAARRYGRHCVVVRAATPQVRRLLDLTGIAAFLLVTRGSGAPSRTGPRPALLPTPMP